MIENAEGPGVHCCRCFGTAGIVRIEVTCQGIYDRRTAREKTPVVYLCGDCLREAVRVAERVTQ